MLCTSARRERDTRIGDRRGVGAEQEGWLEEYDTRTRSKSAVSYTWSVVRDVGCTYLMQIILRSLTQAVPSEQSQHGADDFLVSLQICGVRTLDLLGQLCVKQASGIRAPALSFHET